LLVDRDDAIRIGVGLRGEQNRANDREQRDVGADANGQRQHRGRSEGPPPAERAQRVADVVQQGFEDAHRSCDHITEGRRV
jgi:hypothetical protein